jgi:hypothetical protein
MDVVIDQQEANPLQGYRHDASYLRSNRMGSPTCKIALMASGLLIGVGWLAIHVSSAAG